MNDYRPAAPNTFLDAVAFVVAHQNRDEDTCHRILDSNSDDPAALITVLAQYCATAIRTEFAMTIEEWAGFQAENTLEAMRKDVTADLREEQGWE